MADDRDPDRPPEYRVYRSRPRLLRRRDEDLGTPPPREQPPQQTPPAANGGDDRPYTVHRAGGGPRIRLPRPGGDRARGPRLGGRFTKGRIAKYVALAVLGWIALSVVLFFVSAQIQREGISDRARAALGDSGYTLTSPNTILVLGSDARSKDTAEPGSSPIGAPSRSDTILLLRAGGGRSARLSIPRDTIVDVPGHGRGKINSAYAYGGPALAIETIEQYLGIEINHLVEVNFANFPAFIDALGGIDIRTSCVVSRINGGNRNGGYTLRLGAGEHHIDGKQALALARTRKNDCKPSENDLTRARRQQKILSAIKGRLVSPPTFFRLPWVSWAAPKAVRSDMGGAALLGLFGAIATSGSPDTEVLGRIGPDGNPSVTEDVKRREVARFLDG
ncbi:MAG TPA: LCP family protein [Solirubrobacteraceae bacterium]|jgi:LCP family protein required for cell wall assembly